MTKRILMWVASGLLAGGLGLASIGCSVQTGQTPDRPPAAQLKQGITVLQSSPDWGMDVAFKKDTHVVYLQTRVGPLKPEAYRKEFPNEPAHEMDARFVDANGFTFILQIGGDSLIDASWAKDMANGELKRPDTAAQVHENFALAREASNSLKTVLPQNQKAEFAPTLYHFKNLVRQLPTERPQLKARADLIKAKLAKLPADHAYNSSCYYNWFEGDEYGKCIFSCVGHHSAVLGWEYSNCTGTWDEEVVACNHGSCATDSSMSYQGYYTTSGWVGGGKDLASGWSYEKVTNLSTTYNYGCQTGYNWDTPPGHECNDDTAYELWQIHDAANYSRGNSSHGNGTSFCAKHTVSHWYGDSHYGNACSCSDSCNDCSGDWSYPSDKGTLP